MSMAAWFRKTLDDVRLRRLPRERRRRLQRHAPAPAPEVMESRVLLAAVHWISDADGFWDDPANWQDQSTLANRVPGGGDDVVINRPAGSVTVTVRGGAGHQFAGTLSLAADETLRIAAEGLSVQAASTVVGSIELTGGFLQSNGTVTHAGELLWERGHLGGTNRIATSGTLRITTDDDKSIAANVTNEGMVVHSGSGDVIDVASGGGSVWTNASGAIYDFTGEGSRNATTTFTNRGTVRKSAGSGESRFTNNFNNEGGTVDAQSGTLRLSQGTNTGGHYMAAANAVVDMTGGGTARWFGTLTGSGAGRVEFSSGTFSTHTGSATLDFPAGLLHWTGATASGLWINAGTFQISGDSDRAIAATITNNGTVVHSGAGDVIDVASGGGSVWVNAAGSTYSFAADDSRNATTTFTNRGTVRKSGGSGESRFTGNFNNEAGTVDAQSGTLRLSQGTNTGATTWPRPALSST
jgi:hypothetical protein